MRARLHLRPVLLLLALLAGLVPTAGAASADDGDVSWGVRTASNGFGADRDNYVYDVAPGGSVTDALVVSNHGTKRLELAVYAADGYTNGSGNLDLLTHDQTSTGVGAWTQTEQPTVSIGPGRTVDVPFTVDVPEDASPGDFVGGIITSLGQPQEAGGITVDRRLALKIALRVGGTLAPALSVSHLHVDVGDASATGSAAATVTYTVRNTGNASISGSQAVRLTGPLGALGHDAPALDDLPVLLPGDEKTVSVEVDGVREAVRLHADVTVTPMLTDASGSTASLDPVEADTAAWAVPWLLLAGIVLLVLAVMAAIVVARRRRRGARARDEERVRAAVAQALQERDTASVGALDE